VSYHFLRDHVEKGDIELAHVSTQDQLADIFCGGTTQNKLD